jgi:hypothetical protein
MRVTRLNLVRLICWDLLIIQLCPARILLFIGEELKTESTTLLVLEVIKEHYIVIQFVEDHL